MSLYNYAAASTAGVAYSPYLSEATAAAAGGAPGLLSAAEPYLPSDLPSLHPEHSASLFAASLYGSATYDAAAIAAGAKRSAEAAYHPSVLGSQYNIWQPDALYSSNPLMKRPRVEYGSNIPIYPQRPGEKDCAFYMSTRTCKFGDSCKYDHPPWVPEGGIPDWKESIVPTTEPLPERPGEPDCPFYLKTQKCKFGTRCKFNHPKENASAVVAEGTEAVDTSVLPERPTEPICAFYAKTGTCKFGATCKFHHPKDIQIPSNKLDNGNVQSGESTFVPVTPALVHNSKGLPIRPGETDCPFYLKTGSCKYGANCRYNHPDMNFGAIQAVVPSPAATLAVGLFNPAASYLPKIDMHPVQAPLGFVSSVYPQRPGGIECDFYMKTGHCRFGERCRFHHPIDRSVPTTTIKQTSEQSTKLTLAGLPRRNDAAACSYYMKTGTCKFGVACRFDHPPPREAIALATGIEEPENGAGVATNEE